MEYNYLNEIWKDIKCYVGLYQISNYGRVFSKRKNKILSLSTDWKGYLRVALIKDKQSKWFKVHRLVAQAFIPNPSNYPQVNHKDENKLNNCVSNLEWVDASYNNNYGTRNIRVSEKLSKPVCQYDMNGNFIKEFKSLSDTKNEGFSPDSIGYCCRGKTSSSGGYRWKYNN